jgi:hypothetical protein
MFLRRDQPPGYTTLHLTIEACSFNGTLPNGTETSHRAIYVPDGDNYVFVTGNDFFGYGGLVVVTLDARSCSAPPPNVTLTLLNGTQVSFSKNLVRNAPCAAAEVVGWDSITAKGNDFEGCGCYPGFVTPLGQTAAYPQDLYCFFVSACNDTPGFLTVSSNSVHGNGIPPCVLGALNYSTLLALRWPSGLPASFYISPLPVLTKVTSVSRNRATADSCIGIRFDQVEQWTCGNPDPPKWLRPYWFNGGSRGEDDKTFGQVFDLYWGPPSQDILVALDPNSAVPIGGFTPACYWCNDGCTTPAIGTFVIVLGLIFLALLALCIFCFVCLPCLCCLCPCAQAPQGMAFESYLGISIPADQHAWFRASAEVRQTQPVVQDSPLDQQMQDQAQAVRQRRAMGTFPQTPGYSDGS